ncbi:hypothetical protein ACLGI4_27550 [Streptomyces sp. HMX112]|uniref:hypothetical protein n=1 Tax=Streptomyces sp. HMX112 TaxID=3390850 RepID=UPI003A810900
MTNTRRERSVLAAATAALVGGLLAPAAPAAAAPAQAAPATAAASPVRSAAEARGTAPACVSRDVIKHEKTVTVGNDCGQVMHLKVVINNGPDLRCWTYQRGEAWVWKWKTGSYGKVVTC